MKRRNATATSQKSNIAAKKPAAVVAAVKDQNIHATVAQVKGKWYLPLFLAAATLIPLVVFLRTLNIGMAGGDWGELVVNQFNFGVPHPPGYPTFMTIGYLWIHFVPIPGSIAYRANTISAVLSSGASAFLFMAVLELIVSISNKTPSFTTLTVALFGSLLYSFSSIVWTYSLHAEVFPLNNFFCALLLYLTFKYVRTRSVSVAVWGAFICGFALTNQHTLVVFEAIIVPWILFIGRKELMDIRTLINLGVAFLIGFSPYVLLFVSQMIHLSKYSWGDLLTLHGYFVHLTRQEYGSFQLYKTDSSGEDTNPPYLLKLQFYFSNLINSEFGITGALFALLGAAKSLGSRRAQIYTTPLLACFIFYGTWFFQRCNLPLDDELFLGVWYRFFPQINMLVAIMSAVGLFSTYSLLSGKMASPSSQKWVLKSLVIVAVVVLIGSQIRGNFWRLDQSENIYIESYGRALLESLPNSTIVLLKGDLESNAANYLHLVEGVRPDLTLLSVNHMTYDWWKRQHQPLYPHIKWPNNYYHPYKPDGFNIGQFFEANIDKYPIVSISGWKAGDNSVRDPKWHIARFGIGERVFRASKALALTAKKSERDRNFELVIKKFKAMDFPAQLDALPRAQAPKYGGDSWEIRSRWLLTSNRSVFVYDLILLLGELHGYEKNPIFLKILETAIHQTEILVDEFESLKQFTPTEKYKDVYKQAYRNRGIVYDNANKWLMATSESGAVAGLSQKDVLTRLVTSWEMVIRLQPDDTAVSGALDYWRAYLRGL